MRSERANRLIKEGLVDSVAFGRLYIANPDLVKRLYTGTPLAGIDWSTAYASGPRGYGDYPTYSELLSSDGIQDEALREQSKKASSTNAQPAALLQVVASKRVIKREPSSWRRVRKSTNVTQEQSGMQVRWNTMSTLKETTARSPERSDWLIE